MQTNLSEVAIESKPAGTPPRGLALLVSVSLHIVLLAPLVVLKSSPLPVIVDSPSVMQIAFVREGENSSTEGDAEAESRPDDGATDNAADDVTDDDVADNDERPADPVVPGVLPAPAVEIAVDEASASVAPDPTSVAPEAVDDSVSAAEIAAEAEAEEAIAETPVLEPAPEPEPAPTTIETVPMEPRTTVPVVATERSRLERRVASWARSFAALSEWEPNTSWKDRGQTYTATVANLPAADSMGIDEAIVTISTERDGQRFSTEMRMQRLGFSHFAQFIDRWDPNVQIHDDQIDGRFHSNSEISIANSRGVQPTFLGKVTTSRDVNTSNSARRIRRADVFLGGLETGVSRIGLPKRVSLFTDDNSIDADRVQRFNSDTRIRFHADGTYSWNAIERRARNRRRAAEASTTDAETPLSGEREQLSDEPHYFIAGDKAEVHVSGIVNGKVFVYSPEGIVIEDDIVYAADPTVTPNSDDYLGLVSERTVEIAAQEITGPGDVTVHAAIYAKRRFAVIGFRRSEKATLHVFGSVAAGTLSATEPRFRTKLNFDDRLANLRPPNFPVTDSYEITEWDGLWTQE